MNRSNRPLTRWLLLPIIAILSILGIVIVAGLYFTSPNVYPFWFPFPFFPLVLIPVFILIFFGFRFFFWGCWGWGRSPYYGQYFDPALVTLRERYAKGEITKEQLEQMARDLGQ